MIRSPTGRAESCEIQSDHQDRLGRHRGWTRHQSASRWRLDGGT